MVILRGCNVLMQFVATVGITFQMCILVTGQFGKSISYNKFLVLKVVCIFYFTEWNKVESSSINCVCLCWGSRRVLWSLLLSTEGLCSICVQFVNIFYLQNMYLKQLKS